MDETGHARSPCRGFHYSSQNRNVSVTVLFQNLPDTVDMKDQDTEEIIQRNGFPFLVSPFPLFSRKKKT